MERRCPGGCVPLSGLTVWKHNVSTLLIFPGKFVLSTQSSYPSLLCPLVISSSTLAFLVHFMSFILELACLHLNFSVCNFHFPTSQPPMGCSVGIINATHPKSNVSSLQKSCPFFSLAVMTLSWTQSCSSEILESFLIPPKSVTLIGHQALINFHSKIPLQCLSLTHVLHYSVNFLNTCFPDTMPDAKIQKGIRQ